MTSIEQHISACLGELAPNVHHKEHLRHLISHAPCIDVDHLIDRSFNEGLSSLLYKNLLQSGGLECINPAQKERLQTLYYKTAVFNLKLIQDLKHILRLLNQKEIQVVLLQGIGIVQQIYHDIALRPMGDIDLWVLPKNHPSLIHILRHQGYRQDPIYAHIFRKGSTTFDIHTQILWADRIKASKLLLAKSENNIYLNCRPLSFEGQKALCLHSCDQIIYLCLHALKHRVDKLIWLMDIKLSVDGWERADWKGLIRRAQELGQMKTISYIFFILQLFDFKLPPEANEFFNGENIRLWEKKILQERIKKDSLPGWGPPLLFSSTTRWRQRFYFIMETLFPRPEILRQVFAYSPSRTIFQLYWRRFAQILKMIEQQTITRQADSIDILR
ncbi:MAG: nucleotidyltransferase family protein [bacterium]